MARSAILHDRNYGLLFFIELAVAHNVQMLKAANIYHFNCVINKVKFRETTAKCLTSKIPRRHFPLNVINFYAKNAGWLFQLTE